MNRSVSLSAMLQVTGLGGNCAGAIRVEVLLDDATGPRAAEMGTDPWIGLELDEAVDVGSVRFSQLETIRGDLSGRQCG
jgi:hypothetical protein